MQDSIALIDRSRGTPMCSPPIVDYDGATEGPVYTINFKVLLDHSKLVIELSRR
jgi:hypothetical protein